MVMFIARGLKTFKGTRIIREFVSCAGSNVQTAAMDLHCLPYFLQSVLYLMAKSKQRKYVHTFRDHETPCKV